MKKGIFTLFLFCLLVVNAIAQPLTCVNWVNMASEPDYAAVPYEQPTHSAVPTPAGWTFDAATLDFDVAWAAAGDEAYIAKATNTAGGDLFDLGTGNTYGASWKAMYDTTNIYVLINWIGADKAYEGALNMEVMFQPTSTLRYEPDFTAAAGDKVLQNNSYARFVELGGAKVVFKDATVTEAKATLGTTAAWSDNTHALTELALITHYWNLDGSVVKAVMVLPFSALSYPTDPFGALDVRTPLEVTAGETKISWEMKANIKIDGDADANKMEHCWSSTANNVYAVNYYAGYLLLDAAAVGLSTYTDENVFVYYSNNQLNIRGIENTSVQVFNINGQLVKSAQIVSGEVNIENLSNGVYLVRIGNSEKMFKISKF